MPGPLKANDVVALAAAMCARDALKVLHAVLPPGYRPGAHCYALSRVTALLLNRLGFDTVRCVVGHADAEDWLHNQYAGIGHAWIEDGDWRFDPKSAVVRMLISKSVAATYTNYREAAGEEAERLRKGFLNACGMADDVIDVVVDACERATKPSEAA